MKRISLTLLTVLLLGLFVLVGCQQQIEPENILVSMMKFSSEIKQVNFAGQFSLVGASRSVAFNGLNDLSVDAVGQIDLTSADDLRYSANLNVSGTSAEGSTRIGAELRSLSEYSYFKVTDISMPLGLPFSLAADDKWYKIKKSGLTGENTLGGSNKPISDSEMVKIRELVTEANLFTVTQILPEEVINNFTSYHFKAKINTPGLRTFLEGLAKTTNNRISIDIPYLIRLGEDSSFDLWITKKNFSLAKLKITSLNNTEVDLPNFKFELNLSQFNLPIDIKPPAVVTSDFSLEKFFGVSLNNL